MSRKNKDPVCSPFKVLLHPKRPGIAEEAF